MAQFRGTLQGARGEASRLGTKKNGLRATVNGWNNGIKVVAYHDEEQGDCFRVSLTGGSNGQGPDCELLTMINGEVKTAQGV